MPRPQRTIAILTDLGEYDWYVASIKAAITRIAPEAQLIDITHHIDAGNVHAGAFVLSQCYRDFPDKTVFLCVVDPGIQSSSKPVILYTGDHYFVAPDNGILGLLKPSLYRAFEIDLDLLGARLKANRAFNGKDVLAPTAALLAAGVTPSELGQPIPEIVSLDFDFTDANELPCKGYIIYFDQFGNAISNLKMAPFAQRPSELELRSGRKIPFHSSQSDLPAGQTVAYLGSGGLVEIALNRGNARQELDLESDSEFVLR